MIATIAEIVAVDSDCAIPFEPSMYDRHKIQPVTLVPMLAPMMIPIACATFIIPEFTKPTTITVVAEEDWMIAVTAVPSEDSFQRCVRQLIKNQLQLITRYFLQSVSHQGHTKKEQCHSAERR